jgi:hypothetical protein
VRRRLLNLLTAVSLLLCVVVCVMWVRSRFASDWINYARLSRAGDRMICREMEFLWARGTGVAQWRRFDFEQDVSQFEWGWTFGSAEPEPGLSGVDLSRAVLGFRWSSGKHPSDSHVALVFPLWAAVLLLATLPAVRLYRRVRGPTKKGLCPRCGYDLRATPDRCPECGCPTAKRGAA